MKTLNAVLGNIALVISPSARALLKRIQYPTIVDWIGSMHTRSAQNHVLGGWMQNAPPPRAASVTFIARANCT